MDELADHVRRHGFSQFDHVFGRTRARVRRYVARPIGFGDVHHTNQRGTLALYAMYASPCRRVSHGSSINTTLRWKSTATIPA